MTRMRTPLSAELRAAAISLLHKDPSVLRRQGPNNGGPPLQSRLSPKRLTLTAGVQSFSHGTPSPPWAGHTAWRDRPCQANAPPAGAGSLSRC